MYYRIYWIALWITLVKSLKTFITDTYFSLKCQKTVAQENAKSIENNISGCFLECAKCNSSIGMNELISTKFLYN